MNDPAFENEYAPFGVDSGLCMGVAATAFQGEGVTLQPCGVSSKTVWILDTADQFSFITALRNGVPLINGSDTNFSHPFVLTYPASGVPTDKPRPQLTVTNLTGFSKGIWRSHSEHHQLQPALGRYLRGTPLRSLNSHPE